MNSSSADIALSLWWWTVGEYAATLLVILGVIGEYVADFTKWAKKKPGRKDRIGKRATLLLIAGLAGELTTLVQVNRYSGLEIAQISERAEQLRADNLAQQTIIEELRRGVAEANAHTAEAQRETEAVRQMAEQERTERLKIEEARADRRLTEDQHRLLVDEIEPWPCLTVGIIVAADTLEARKFAGSFADVFRTVEWKTTWATRTLPAALPGIGVDLEGRPLMAQQSPIAVQLYAAFRRAGLLVNPFLPFFSTRTLDPNDPQPTFSGKDKDEALAAPLRLTIGMHPRGY